jgi:hypothetical protein
MGASCGYVKSKSPTPSQPKLPQELHNHVLALRIPDSLANIIHTRKLMRNPPNFNKIKTQKYLMGASCGYVKSKSPTPGQPKLP